MDETKFEELVGDLACLGDTIVELIHKYLKYDELLTPDQRRRVQQAAMTVLESVETAKMQAANTTIPLF